VSLLPHTASASLLASALTVASSEHLLYCLLWTRGQVVSTIKFYCCLPIDARSICMLYCLMYCLKSLLLYRMVYCCPADCCERLPPREASDAELLAVHSPGLIAAVAALSHANSPADLNRVAEHLAPDALGNRWGVLCCSRGMVTVWAEGCVYGACERVFTCSFREAAVVVCMLSGGCCAGMHHNDLYRGIVVHVLLPTWSRRQVGVCCAAAGGLVVQVVMCIECTVCTRSTMV
jgi:hypothetical protein